jgi:carbamoyl-phosphate synthase small subunit
LDSRTVVRPYSIRTAPGPNDADPLFTDFYNMIEKRKAGKV